MTLLRLRSLNVKCSMTQGRVTVRVGPLSKSATGDSTPAPLAREGRARGAVVPGARRGLLELGAPGDGPRLAGRPGLGLMRRAGAAQWPLCQAGWRRRAQPASEEQSQPCQGPASANLKTRKRGHLGSLKLAARAITERAGHAQADRGIERTTVEPPQKPP
jgi:hypothetical protein